MEHRHWFTDWIPNIHPEDLFRSYEEPGVGKAASFGCSFTWGYGISMEETWSFLLGLVNMGQSGASNDYICRVAIEYCENFKPEDIYVMWTYPNRREIIDDRGMPLKYKATDTTTQKYRWHQAALELGNDYSDEYNRQKNIFMLNTYCKANNINIHQLLIDDIPNDGEADDGMHPGPQWNDHVAEYFRFN